MTGRNPYIAVGAIIAGLGVAAGAFGAHALGDVLAPDRLEVYDTAVRYQLIHAVALVLVGILSERMPSTTLRGSGIAFATGIVLFSGSLYLLVLTGLGGLGAVTPFGGVAFLVGWTLLATAALNPRRPPRTGA